MFIEPLNCTGCNRPLTGLIRTLIGAVEFQADVRCFCGTSNTIRPTANTPAVPDCWVSVGDAAAAIQLSTATIKRMIRAGQIRSQGTKQNLRVSFRDLLPERRRA